MDRDELPILEEEPLRSLEVPARALRPQGPRGNLTVAVWLGAIAVVVGTAVLWPRGVADTGERPSHPDAAVASDLPAPSAGRLVRWYGPAPWLLLLPTATPRPVQVIDLASPGPGIVEVTSNRLTVAGHVLVRAARIEVVLAANGNRLFGEASLDVADRDGGIRPAQSPAFAIQFDLATPRPIGTMLVVVTAYDASGAPIGGVRRAISIGPLRG